MWEASEITLNKQAYRNNVAFIRSLVNDTVTISAVVKGNAYGHGTAQFIPMAQDAGVDHFSVYSMSEAKDVYESAIKPCSIMIMGRVSGAGARWVIEHGIEFYVFDFKRLEEAMSLAIETGKPALVHLEIETGMNRIGFEKQDWERLATFLKDNRDHLAIKGLCTHFAGAEAIVNDSRIQKQKAVFADAADFLESRGVKAERKHTCSSSATIRYPEMQLDLVRVGILQYGFWPTDEIYSEYLQRNDQRSCEGALQQVLSWKTHIMSIKRVPKGRYVGYGMSYLTQKPSVLACLPVGYVDGYSRDLSNNAHVLIHGVRLPVVGVVNMNMMMVDVTSIADRVKKGDPVVLVGEQEGLKITFSSFCEMNSGMNYEMLARLPRNIPRKVVE